MDSLRTALEREHAAVFSYGVVAAFSLSERREFTAAGAEEHRARRDAVSGLLARAGGEIPLAAPAYELPVNVDSPVTAAELAVFAEQECAAAWRAVTERADNGDLREFSVGALTECALRTARWRGVLGAAPIPDPFPGELV
nr:ferritin-like domain-containing protein [Hoyosella altamirensis]